MNITIDHEPVIHLSGEWSADHASLVAATQLIDLRELPRGRVTLDFAGVAYMDSAGLCAVVAACAKAHSAGRIVSLRNVTPAVTQLIELCRLNSVFRHCETPAARLTA